MIGAGDVEYPIYTLSPELRYITGLRTVTAMQDETNDNGTLRNYRTGEAIRPATAAEEAESIEAAKRDGGHGLIVVDGVTCYVD